MKQLIKVWFKELVLLLLISFYQITVLAQDRTGNSNQTTTTTTSTHTSAQTDVWYTQPWVWIAGGVLFILLLVALFRGRNDKASNTDRVSVTKTVRRESDSA